MAQDSRALRLIRPIAAARDCIDPGGVRLGKALLQRGGVLRVVLACEPTPSKPHCPRPTVRRKTSIFGVLLSR